MLPRHVVGKRSRFGRFGPDEAKHRVRRRIAGLPLERQQPAPQDVGLGGGEVTGQMFQPLAAVAIEVYLDRRCSGNALGRHVHEEKSRIHDSAS